MGLSDLKKNAMSSKEGSPPQSLDEFIDAATWYAMGDSLHPNMNPASKNNEGQQTALTPSNVVSLPTVAIQYRAHKPKAQGEPNMNRHSQYRKATFSLSESAIRDLAKLAKESKVSKSKLLRLLIEQHNALPSALRQMREQTITRS